MAGVGHILQQGTRNIHAETRDGQTHVLSLAPRRPGFLRLSFVQRFKEDEAQNHLGPAGRAIGQVFLVATCYLL